MGQNVLQSPLQKIGPVLFREYFDSVCFGQLDSNVGLDSGIIMWIVGAPCGNSSSRAPQRATWSHFNNIIYHHYDQNTLIFGRHVFGLAFLAGLPSWENNSG